MTRKPYLDNIRWITVVLVMIYHVFYLFNHAGVPASLAAPAGAAYADVLLYVLYPWFMTLLFLIAGMSARYALASRTDKAFLKSKVDKLLVPSTLGLLVYQWIGGYLNVKIGGGLDTLPAPLRYPIFALSGTGPLWFIQMLFLFSLALVLLRRLDRSDRLWTLCGRCGLPWLLLLAVPLWGTSMVGNLPVLTTYRFGIYFFTYLAGYYVFSHEEAQQRLMRARVPLLLAALALCAAFTVRFFGQDYTRPACLTHPLTNLYAWIAMLAILGCGKAWLDRPIPLSARMGRVSFGWYVLHYPVTLAVCYVLYTYCALSAPLLYALSLLLEFLLTAALYALFSRVPVVRYLVLGIRRSKAREPEKVGQARG